jgi:hypothetical protein
MDEEGEISVTLSLRQWRAVAALVEGGIWRDVQIILDRIYAQVNGKIMAARERAALATTREASHEQTETAPAALDDIAELQTDAPAIH